MTRRKKVVAIVPAAGMSSRFGGPNKLLMPWGAGTLIGSVVSTLRESGLSVVVVTGRDRDRVADAVSPALTVFNPRFAEGLGISITCGVEVAGEADGYLIALADMPSLRADVVSLLLDEFERQPPSAIIAPVYGSQPDRPGHPVLFGIDYRKDLLQLAGDVGARSVIEQNRDRLRPVPIDGRFTDVDRPSDLESGAC